MIITLTGNLLAERTLEFASWQPGKTQRAAAESFQVGGKGINVSKMLARLGAPTVAACFAGGETGDECLRWLQARRLPHHVFRTTVPTRTGTVVRVTHNTQPETTFLGMDAAPDPGSLAECAAWLDAQPAACVLAICGSFPGFLSPAAGPLRDAISRRIALGNVCVDTYGPPLAWLVAHPVELVKINRGEFDLLCASFAADPVPGESFLRGLAPANPMPERLAAACRQWPVRRWIVTDGPGPVWFAARDGAPPASCQPPSIREVSATGSGDVLFAVVMHNLINRHFSLAESVTDAITCASSNASTSGIAEANTN